jgi:hypothetical protein
VSSMPRRRAFIGKRAASKVEPWKIVKAGTGLGEPHFKARIAFSEIARHHAAWHASAVSSHSMQSKFE